MKLLIDAQLSPSLAAWINRTFSDIHADSVWSLELRDKSDKQIFEYASENGYIIVSKDVDFMNMIERYGAPPNLIWITCGNTSNAAMRKILSGTLSKALELISGGESIVEISDKPSVK